MDYLVTAIFGKRALHQLSAADYAHWAGEMLVEGYDSRSLRMLAGMNTFASSFEADDYFLNSITELNLIPPNPDIAIRAYACEIARRIIEDKITAEEGVRTLFGICMATEYASDFVIWFQLDDALDSLHSGNYPFTYESATLENFGEIAKHEAANFIAAIHGQFAI